MSRTILFNGFEISDAASRIEFARVHEWIAGSYWATGIPEDRFRRAVENSSLVAGAYHPEHGQCAFARVVTDFTRFAYLMDVYVAASHRGGGLGKTIIAYLLEHPRMSDIDTWSLGTKDAHGLYETFGFVLEEPGRWMVRRR